MPRHTERGFNYRRPTASETLRSLQIDHIDIIVFGCIIVGLACTYLACVLG